MIKKLNKAKEIITRYLDDFFVTVGLCLFVHSSFRIHSIFGEYVLSLIIIFTTVLITKFKSKRRR